MHQQKHPLCENYELVRVLGRGSFGTAYLIRNLKTQKQYALKKQSWSFLQKKGKEINIIRAIWILQNLSHPNIIKFYNYTFKPDEDHIYIFFEPCKKGSLEQFSKVLYKIKNIKIIKYILYQLIEAMKYLKTMNVAHRDIKPSNITFTSQGVLKLIDFDEAICFDERFAATAQSQILKSFGYKDNEGYLGSKRSQVSYGGTKAYMPPQMNEYAYADERGDVWAFGCILYELYMGEYIFVQYNNAKSYEEQLQNKLQSANKSIEDKQAIRFMIEILNINPQQRPVVEHIYINPFFDEIRVASNQAFAKRKFIKMLRGNYCQPNKFQVESEIANNEIEMPFGKQLFENLKTPVLLRSNSQYTVYLLAGGIDYFKLKNYQNNQDFKYIHYDTIEEVCLIEDHILFKIEWEKWTEEKEKHRYSDEQKINAKLKHSVRKNILIKHIYPQMLHKLYQLIQLVLRD